MELGGALGIGPQKKTPLSSVASGDTSYQRKKAKYCREAAIYCGKAATATLSAGGAVKLKNLRPIGPSNLRTFSQRSLL